MSVHTYLCKILTLVWCNVNRIESVLNQNWVSNSWEVSRIEGFVNLKNHPQTRTKGFIQ
jgi:hypothetical protein